MRTGLISTCAVLVLAAGCREAALDDLRGDAQDVLDEARSRAQTIGELSADEIGELWAIEYRTLLVPRAGLGTLDEQLNALRAGAVGVLPRERGAAGDEVLLQASEVDRDLQPDPPAAARRVRVLTGAAP